MISLLKQDPFSKTLLLVGKSTDDAPTETFTYKGAALPVVNGSILFTADDSKYYLFDEDNGEWIEQSGGGESPEGTITITQNGSGIDVKQYASADVAVPNSYSAGDEGKVVSSGALVAQSSRNIDANGTIDTTLNNEVVVAVPNSYSSGDEGKVVDQGALVSQTSRNITSNGTVDTTLNNEVVVNVPDSVAGILEGTITSLSNSDAVSVRDECFYFVSSLQSVDLPAVKTIGSAAFHHCTGLTSLSIPLVEEIGVNAFYQAGNIQFLNAPHLTTIRANAFINSGLTGISAPLVNNLGNGAFQSCSMLAGSVRFDVLAGIPTYAFFGCSRLEQVDLVTARFIQDMAFYQTGALSALILRKTDSICDLYDSNALTYSMIAYGQGYIYVPSSLKSTYEQATNWVTYASQFRALEDYTVDGTTTGALDPSKI